MWTPKRILMLAFGLVVFVTSYLVYGRFLGGIDGLPPLPQNLCKAADTTHPIIDLPQPPNPLLGRLRLAFGDFCPELNRPIKLELNGKSTVLTADSYFIEKDGRLRLEPLSVALFGKEKPDGGKDKKSDCVEINTIRCKKAYLTFDKPLEKFTDVNGRKIVAAELIDRIEVVNNHSTRVRTDDLTVTVDHGPLYYDEKRHLIWTHDSIHLMDAKDQPPMDVRGQGLEMELAVEAPVPPPNAPPNYKPKSETITGVKRIVLQSNVEMHLYVDPRSGFPGGQQPPDKAAAVAPAAALAPEDKAHVTIKAPGRFQYDLFKDYDLAHFDVAVGDGVNLGKSSLSPHDVTVTRHNVKLNLIDQLISEKLDLKLIRRENKPGAKTAPGPADQSLDRSLEIETTHATGKIVTITSDAEKLTAMGGDLFYDAKTRLTILKGNPEMFAIKEDNTIHARELQMQEMTGPGGKVYQQATALGPGRIEMIDKDSAPPADKGAVKPDAKPAGPKKPLLAFWDDTLVSTKDGPYDLLILNRAARFIDEEHNQTLQGDVLKVWLGNADKPTTATAQPAPSSAQQARKPHHVEAYGNVSARSSELIVHETSRLVVWFRDEEAPSVLPAPAVGNPALPLVKEQPLPAAPVMTAPPGQQVVGKAPVPPGPMATAPPAPKEPAPPRPIDLTARSVEARVLRSEVKNTLETLRCEGQVHVTQAPEKEGDKGVDITGSKLAMDYHPDGNLLVVTGEAQDTTTGDADVAILQMDKMLIIGNDVHIDQATNRAWVIGPGAMTMESETSFSGEKLQKTVPLTVHWNESMLFNGNYAEYHSGIQAEQENARLACESLVVYFDRRISLKEGNKSEHPARVQHMVCDHAVRFEDSTYEGKERTKFQQIVTPAQLSINALYPEDADPTKAEQVSDGNEVRAGGPGEVRIMQKGGVDPLAPPPAPPVGAQAAPSTTRPPPKPAAKPAAKPEDDQMKMTYVNYATSMYANSKKNYAKFIGNVRVLNFPCTEPHTEINLDLVLAAKQLPEGTMYLSSDVLEVWSHQAKDRKYSEMHAAGRALVQSNEFWGRGASIHFDEAKDQVIFDGGNGNATLFKIVGKGVQPERLEGKKIIYIRSTGRCWVLEGKSMEGMSTPGK